MKMEPGRPASPAGGARPDPEPDPEPEPAGPTGRQPRPPRAGHSAPRSPEPARTPAGPPTPGPGPRPPCAAEPDGVCPPPCPDAAPLRGRALGHGPLAGGDVACSPGFPAPAGGELALDVGPEAPGRPPDFGHPCPLATEPAACPEDGPRLRAVFDALDGDGDGLVRIEDFVQFATVYGADQRESTHKSKHGYDEGEKQREGAEPNVPPSRDPEIMTRDKTKSWMLNQLSHPGALF
ncbi:rab11 family-interacting protein 3-like [Canis lupus familiaris]|uniref:rab11 family-interacting protein 3-like n=1 Tax=Canis lupus familiaris TaxID=9615 RepID=UPI0018F6D7E7|nr:rab11 family-interacting protein 3-like [Canis lupus familiaris]